MSTSSLIDLFKAAMEKNGHHPYSQEMTDGVDALEAAIAAMGEHLTLGVGQSALEASQAPSPAKLCQACGEGGYYTCDCLVTSEIPVIVEGDYKVYEINGERFFPESAVHMLIGEAKKLSTPKPVATGEIPDTREANYKCGYYDGVKAERERLSKPVSVDLEAGARAIAEASPLFSEVDWITNKAGYLREATSCAKAWGLKCK